MGRYTFSNPAGIHYWIIGAAGGIGAALCKELHGRGAILTLSGRDEEALKRLKAELGNDRCHVRRLDISVADDVAQAAQDIGAESVVMLSAIYRTPEATGKLSPEQSAKIIEVNLTGAFYLTSAVIPLFQQKGRGQLTLCASVAGYSGLPAGQPYCATKAGLINLAESLRAEHVDSGIDIKMICPGFVKTPLTDSNDFPMPMIISAEAAGKALTHGLTRKGFEIHFPKRFTYILKFLRILPYCLYIPIAKRIKP